MLSDKILSDYKEAMKSRETLRASVLNFLRAELKNVEFAKNKSVLDDAECLTVIRKQIKQRQDSIEQFTNGGRQDLADKETKELAILKAYLPQELSADEVTKIITEEITALGASGMKDMGKVMKEVNIKVAGRFDAKTISDLVRQRLQGSQG